ncbi:MAG: hypothetical protein K2X82_33425 [Gemmataceae bacterium]|nr:hypothetical protein [Gemmataceae bacterium]
MKDGVCPKCQGTAILQGLRVLDRAHGKTEDLTVAAYAKPDAWVFKGEVRGELWACVCGACGFTELYATNLDALVRATVEGQGKPAPDA